MSAAVKTALEMTPDFRAAETPLRPIKPRVNAPKPQKFNKLSRTDCLSLWHQVTLATVRKNAPDLSARQLALLMSVYLEDGPHTVRSLAESLDVTKAAISRAVDRLVGYEYLRRGPDPRDKRSIVLHRTSAGIHYLQGFADIVESNLPEGARLLVS